MDKINKLNRINNREMMDKINEIDAVNYLQKENYNSEKELVRFIADKLPISEEMALDFIIGATTCGPFTEEVNFLISLGAKERYINKLQKEIIALKNYIKNFR